MIIFDTMYTKQIDIRFGGAQFVPSLLKKETNWPLNILVESGQISPRGKFKGKTSPYGIAFLKIDSCFENCDPMDTIQIYSDKLLEAKKWLKEFGVTEIIFDIETSNSQEFHYSLDADIIKKLDKLNARIEFHGNEFEIAFETWLKNTYQISSKFLNEEEHMKFDVIRNKIIGSSANLQNLNMSHIYEFLCLYIIKYMGNQDKDIPSFENSYLQYCNIK